MIIRLFALIIILFSSVIKAQSKNENNLMLDSISSRDTGNTESKESNNLKNFPFQFGAEFGIVTDFAKAVPGVWGFLDINISKRIVFLRLEYGRLFKVDDDNNNAIYGSLGINYKIFKINKHNNFYIHAAVFVVGSKRGGGISGFLSLRYLYAINKYIGLVSSIRNFAFTAIFLSVGIQFFTK